MVEELTFTLDMLFIAASKGTSSCPQSGIARQIFNPPGSSFFAFFHLFSDAALIF
jgi:hypothetical protein